MKPCCSERLVIRPFAEADVQDFFEYRSERENTIYQSYDVFTADECESFIKTMEHLQFGKRGEWIQLAIELKENKKVIGDIGLKPELHDERIVEFGISISKKFQQQGFAKEALQAIVTNLFNDFGIHRVFGIADAENIYSIKLFKRIGMRMEGHYKQSFNNKGKWRDEFLFAILKSEWK